MAVTCMEHTLSQQWQKDGMVIIRQVWNQDRISAIKNIAERILQQWKCLDPQSNAAGDPNGSAISMRHLNHPAYYTDKQQNDFIALMEAAADPAILDICRQLFQAEPLFRCTSLFFNPSNPASDRDGNWHRDSQFTEQDPIKEKQLLIDRSSRTSALQMQIALEPSEDIECVPGSHLRPDSDDEYFIRLQDEQSHNTQAMPNAVKACLQAGDMVFFDPMGLHRGRYHVDKLRRSLMLTYTSSATERGPSDYFNQQKWFLKPNYLSGLSTSTKAFYARFIEHWQDSWHNTP